MTIATSEGQPTSSLVRNLTHACRLQSHKHRQHDNCRRGESTCCIQKRQPVDSTPHLSAAERAIAETLSPLHSSGGPVADLGPRPRDAFAVACWPAGRGYVAYRI